jgi:CheY-like chemotaxis protein
MPVEPPRYVLLVEDQEDNQYLVREFLEWKGYGVKVAGSGEEGLRIAREVRPGVVLMDMTLPGMDGYEATRRMRLIPGCERVPIVALTAHDIREAGQRCFDAGCTAFLAKPFEPDRLLQLVQRYLGNGDPCRDVLEGPSPGNP